MAEIDFLERCYTKNPSMVFRKIADECLLVPISHQVADLNYLFVLNPVAGRIWELIDGHNLVRDIKDQLLAEYDANPQEVEQDLVEFIAQLSEIGSIRET